MGIAHKIYMVDRGTVEICPFSVLLHESVQLGADFCGQLVRLVDETMHRQA